MITTTTTEGQSTSLTFTTNDTMVNEVLVEVFNACSELTMAGAAKVKITVEKIP